MVLVGMAALVVAVVGQSATNRALLVALAALAVEAAALAVLFMRVLVALVVLVETDSSFLLGQRGIKNEIRMD